MRTLFCFLLALPLLADSSITLTNRDASARTNYPVQIGRPFAVGEIEDYPQAVVGGTPVTTQADVKSRWSDGSVKHAILSFLVPSLGASATAVVTFQNQVGCNCGSGARLTKSQMLDAGYDFDAEMELTQAGETITRSARTMLTNDHYTYWAEGSVATTVILADHTGKSYDLGWKRPTVSFTSTAADTATTWAVSDGSQFNAWDYVVGWQKENVAITGYTWKHETARICQVSGNDLTIGIKGTLTTSSNVATIVSGDMINDYAIGATITIDGSPYTVGSRVNNSVKVFNVTGGVPNHASPVEFTICGNRVGRALDDSQIGAQLFSTSNYVSPRDTWQTLAGDGSEDRYKSFRPIVIATFWPTINKVMVRFVGEIGDTERFQNLDYALTLKVGDASPSTVYTNAAVRHHALARWTKPVAGDPEDSGTHQWIAGRAYYWIGGAPGSTNINHNAPYLISTKFLPNYDLSRTGVQATVDSRYSRWLSEAHSFMGDIGAFSFTYWGDGGLWPERGWFASWMTWWLYTMDYKGAILVNGSADLHAASAVHFREGSSTRNGGTRYYDVAGTVPALGKAVSTAGRPTQDFGSQGYTATVFHVDDRLTPVGAVTVGSKYRPVATATTARTYGGWQPDFNHTPDMQSLSYLLSGDPWYLENMQLMTGWRSIGEPRAYRSSTGNRAGFPASTELRNEAWGLRQILQVAMLSPDGSAEKEWAEGGVYNHLQASEAAREITASTCPGAYTSVCSEAYTWGGSNTLRLHPQLSLKLDMLDTNGSGTRPSLGQYRNNYTDEYVNGTGVQSYSLNKMTVGQVIGGFQHGYIIAVLGMAERFGYPATKLLQYIAPLYGGMMDASKGAPFPYLIESGGIPVRRMDWDTSYEGAAVGTDWTSTTDTEGKISHSSATAFNGTKSAAFAMSSTTPAYFTKTGLSTDKFGRGVLLFRFSSDFALGSGIRMKVGEWRNANGAVIAAVFVKQNGSNLDLEGEVYVPSQRKVYSLTTNHFAKDRWVGVRVQFDSTHNTFYGTTYSFSFTDTTYVASGTWTRDGASAVIASPSTFTPRPGTCDFSGGSVSHGFTATSPSTQIVFTGTAPGGFTAGTTYYVVGTSTAQVFQLSDTDGGSPVCPSSSSNVTIDAVDPDLRGVTGKRPVEFRAGVIGFDGGTPSMAGTFYLDDSFYLGNTLRLFTWADFKDAWMKTEAQISPYIGSYREPIFTDKTSWKANSAVEEDFGNIYQMGLAALYPYDEQIQDNYDWFYTSIGSTSSVNANPKWAAIPEGYSASTDPILNSISPPQKTEGDATFTLTASGINFTAASKIYWGGVEQTTTPVGSTTLTASIDSSLIATDGTVSVDVRTSGLPNTSARQFTILDGTPPASIDLAVDPVSLSFAATDGGSDPATQDVTFTATGSAAYSVSDDAAWLSVSPTSGTTTSQALTVTVDQTPSGVALGAGTYNATITITSSTEGVTNSPRQVPVTLVVAPAVPTVLDLTLTIPSTIAVGRACTGTVSAVGGTPPYTFSVTAGTTLPPGCSLSSAGVLSGTTTTVGDFSFGVTATDDGSAAGENSGAISVTASPSLGGMTAVVKPYSTGAVVYIRQPGLDAASTVSLWLRVGSEVIATPTAVASGPAARPYVLTGLTPSTAYTLELGSTTGSYSVAFTTAASDASGVSVAWGGAPPFADVTHVKIERGATSSLGTDSTHACAFGDPCSLSLANDGGAMWLKHTWCTASDCSGVTYPGAAFPYRIQ